VKGEHDGGQAAWGRRHEEGDGGDHHMTSLAIEGGPS
jgi:hypothetical protein